MPPAVPLASADVVDGRGARARTGTLVLPNEESVRAEFGVILRSGAENYRSLVTLWRVYEPTLERAAQRLRQKGPLAFRSR